MFRLLLTIFTILFAARQTTIVVTHRQPKYDLRGVKLQYDSNDLVL